MTFRPGLRIGDKYKLLRRLGAGALGEVWCARNEVVEREVAMKFIAPAWSVDDVAIERFFADAKSSGRIRHPSIVELLDLGRTSSGVAYVVMELLEADKLDEVLARVDSLPTGTSLRIVAEIARALAAAHEKKLPHLRIEPANVLLHRVQHSPKHIDVVPKLVDFGIARLVQLAPARARRIDDLLGPIAYLSPEQTREAEILDVRADVWSLGVLLYHCMVGAPPFAAKTIDELVAAHKAPCVAPNVVDPSIEAVVSHLVMDCLVTRERRPTAKQLADRLDELLRRHDDAWSDLAAVLEIPDDRAVAKLAALDPESVIDEGATPSIRKQGTVTTPLVDDEPVPLSSSALEDEPVQIASSSLQEEPQRISSSALEDAPPSSEEAAPVSLRDVEEVNPALQPRPAVKAASDIPVPLITRVAPRPASPMGSRPPVQGARRPLSSATPPKPRAPAAAPSPSPSPAVAAAVAPSPAPAPTPVVAPKIPEPEPLPISQLIADRLSKPSEDPNDAVLQELEAALLERVSSQRISLPTPQTETKPEPTPDVERLELADFTAPAAPMPVVTPLFQAPIADDETTQPERRVRATATMRPPVNKPRIVPVAIAVVVVGAIAFALASQGAGDKPPKPAATASTNATAASAPTETATATTTATAAVTETTAATTEPTPVPTPTPTPTSMPTPTPTTLVTAMPKPKPTTTPTVAQTPTPKPTVTPKPTGTPKPTATSKPPNDPTYGVHDPGI